MDEQDTQAHIVIANLGRLSDKTWPGRITVNDRFVDVFRMIGTLNDYYVATKPHAKTRCIDGRHDPALNEDDLGPQVPAGAPGAALAYRLGVDKDDLTRGTFYNDVETMINSYLRLGVAPGGHRDDTSGDDKAGCGAIDNVQSILDALVNSEHIDDHKRLVKQLLGPAFWRDDYLRVLGAGVVLEARAGSYFAGSHKIIDLLEDKAPGSVRTLNGEHAEGVVVVNLVPDTTLSSNRFAGDFGVQAFGYDLWRSRQVAEALFPLPDQITDRERFITARVMLTIATLMALTDGSLPLLVRTIA